MSLQVNLPHGEDRYRDDRHASRNYDSREQRTVNLVPNSFSTPQLIQPNARLETERYSGNRGGWRGSGGSGGRGRGRGRYGGYDNSGEKKKRPGGMVPRKVEELPKSVALAKQIITTLVDYSNLSEEDMQPDALASSAVNIAALFVTVGDLYEYPAEISKVFMQCFSTLSMQIPVVAMLVALMHRNECDAEREQLQQETQIAQPAEGGDNAEAAQRSEMAVEASASTVTKRFCERLVNEQLRSHLLAALKAGEILRARLLLRTVACLVCCRSFRLSGFISLLAALLRTVSAPLEVSGLSSPPPRAVEALFLLASSVQWVMGPLTEAAENDPQCEQLLAALETLFARVQGEEAEETGWAQQACPFRVGGPHMVFHSPPFPADPSAPTGSYPSVDPCGLPPGVAQDSLLETVALALKMVRSARSVGAPFLVTHRAAQHLQPWTRSPAREALETEPARMMSFDDGPDMAEEMVRALCERSPASTALAQPHNPASPQAPFLPWLTPRLCLFDQDTSPEAGLLLARTSPLDRHLAHTLYCDTLTFFQPLVNEDGTRTGSVELLARHLLSVSRLFAAGAEGEPLHLEYLLVEHLFQLLLQPPAQLLVASHAGLFKLLLVLCRTDPLVPPVVALAANIAFQMAPDLDPCCWRELARWFSFHLTNTKLSWPYWDFWLDELAEARAGSADRDDPRCCRVSCRGASAQALLVRIVVERCTRASIADRVLRVFPSELAGCIPQLDTAPCCLLLQPTEAAEEKLPAEGEAAGLDESMISVDTNMAVAASASAADADTSLDQLTLSTPYPPERHVADTDLASLAGSLRSQIETRTDPEDVEDWVTAHRRAIHGRCIEKEETRRLLEVPLPSRGPQTEAQEEEDAMDAAAAALLLQSIVSVGGGSSRTLSGLLGLLDRYSDVLRGLAPPENERSHAVLMWTLAACYRHDSGTLQHLLDELLRRGLIAVTAAADWLTFPGPSEQPDPESPLLQLLTDPFLWDMWESCLDRSLDFVRAAVAQRRELGGVQLLDELMDLTPPAALPPSHRDGHRLHPATLSDEPEGPYAIATNAATNHNPNLPDDLEVDYTDDLDDHPSANPNFNNEEEDDEDNDRLLEGRRTRQRTSRDPEAGLGYVESSAEATLQQEGAGEPATAEADSESAVLAAAAMAGQQRGQRQAQHPPEEEEEQEDPVAVYSELVRQAVANARRVYSTMLRALVREHGTVGEAGVSLWQTLCQSLLRRVIGSFADAEQLLSEQHQQRVVLTGSEEELRALLGSEALLQLHSEFYRR
mmetsp:Transcript_10642/g.14651  ORF Transcript_10642/g.14651 Transcript_10642/m.14651 type:complete len:1276 (+) Transcript_10642:85-3912(+)